MSKRMLIIGVGAVVALAIAPSAASAASADPSCNGGSCTPWFKVDVALHWALTPPLVDGDSSTGCSDQTFTTEGHHPVTCTVTWAPDPPADFQTDVKIDKTAPLVTGATPSGATANGAGWFRSPVSWVFDGTDALSGINTCQTTPYSGPDNANASVTGTCTDNAGNVSVSGSQSFKYDATPPVAGATPDRPGDTVGWYNHPVTWTFGAIDATSGLSGCSGPVGYSGPNSLAVALAAGTCTDNAGNAASVPVPVFNYDATSPVITSVNPSRPPDGGGWYNHPLSVSATSGTAGPSGITCGPVAYGGPDGAAIPVTAGCATGAGLSASKALAINYDATAPTVTGAAADRSPDHGGYYNHPVTFTFTGADATSGIQRCDRVTYSGPDDSTAHVTGSCHDNAGNINIRSFEFKYDGTKPRTPKVVATPGSKRVDLSWTGTDATSFVVTRSVIGSSAGAVTAYSGPNTNFVDTKVKNGVRYIYTVTGSDSAGNASSASARAIPTASSLRPFAGTAVGSAPLLTWKKVKRARYYNIQLWRGGKKVLTAWPGRASFQVPQKWRFRGRRYSISAGHYRWWVWPGYGSRSAHRYGKPLGTSSFRLR